MLLYTNSSIIVKSAEYTKDKYGVTTLSDYTILATVEADIQPVSSNYIKKTYGKEMESAFEVLTDFCEYIMEGNYIEVNGINYEIVQVIPYMFDNLPGNIFDPICQFLVKRVD